MDYLEKLSLKITNWVGTPTSILLHTLLFIGVFLMPFFGVHIDIVLLILTTAVSLEAIYLAIFIQMTVNRSVKSLAEVEEDIEDISEEVKDLGEDVEDISEDIDKIQESDKKEELEDEKTKITLEKIETGLQKLLTDIEKLKQQNK